MQPAAILSIKQNKLSQYFNVEAVRILDWAQQDRETLNYTNEQLEWFNGETRFGGYNSSKLNHKKWANIGSDFVLEDGSIDGSADAVDYINEGLSDFYGWECEIGLESLFIFADGEIKRGNCTSFYIGNINKLDEIKWPTNTVICPWHICQCATDVLISKRSPELMKYTNHDRKIFK